VRPLACQLASPLRSGNFSYTDEWRVARDIRQGHVMPAHLTPTGQSKNKSCGDFYTAASIMVEKKGSGALAAPNGLCPEASTSSITSDQWRTSGV